MPNPMIDETGHQYGYLKVLEKAPLPNQNKMGWLCECQLCGNKKIVSGSDLRAGKITTCGCRKQQKIIEQPGTMYGFLEVLKEDPMPARSFPDHCVHWICKCHLCGSTCSVSGRNLRNGMTKSCGCIHSYGEALTAQFLNQNNIPFKKEYVFKDLKDASALRFDFAILNNNNNDILGLIEFNGSQHYDKTFFNATDEKFALEQKHDLMKIDYCDLHGLSLYIISNEANFSKDELEQRLPIILQYIINDIKENNRVKITYIDLRDLSSR